MIKINIYMLMMLIFVCLFVGCTRYGELKTKSPNDDLSNHIKEKLGDDVLYIRNKKEDEVTIYTYAIRNEDKQVVYNLIDSVNECINDNNKVKIIIGTDVGSGGAVEYDAILSNYIKNDDSTKIYNTLCNLDIRYPRTTMSELFLDIKMYEKIDNIKRLEIEKKMQEKADKENIDWNKVWPELEQVDVDNSDWEE
jgi:hypothetical protein